MSVDVLGGGPGLVEVCAVEEVGPGVSSLLLVGKTGFSAVLLGRLVFEGLEVELSEVDSVLDVRGDSDVSVLLPSVELLGRLVFDGVWGMTGIGGSTLLPVGTEGVGTGGLFVLEGSLLVPVSEVVDCSMVSELLRIFTGAIAAVSVVLLGLLGFEEFEGISVGLTELTSELVVSEEVALLLDIVGLGLLLFEVFDGLSIELVVGSELLVSVEAVLLAVGGLGMLVFEVFEGI